MNYAWLCKQTINHVKYICPADEFMKELSKCEYPEYYKLFCIETNCGLNCMTLHYILGNFYKIGTPVNNFNKLGSYIIIMNGETFSHSMTLIVNKKESILLQAYMQEYYMRYDRVNKNKFLKFLKNLKKSRKYIHVNISDTKCRLDILYYGKIKYKNIENNIKLLETFTPCYEYTWLYLIYYIIIYIFN